MGLPPPSAIVMTEVLRGSIASIRMATAAYAEYTQAIDGNDLISVKRKKHLQRYFKEFCENQNYNERLGDEKFKKEGNFSDGRGGRIAVWVFKAFQWRLYGAILPVGGRRCFVGVVVDPAKKRDKANKAMLEATAIKIGELLEYRT